MAKSAIVIGGGIAGCATAHALAKRNIKVTLIEQHDKLGQEASGNPCAMLYPRLSGDDSLSQFAFNAFSHSLAFYRSLNLAAESFNTCGMLQLGYNAREAARIQKVAHFYGHQSEIKWLTAQQASAIAGVEVSHDALYVANAGWVKPQALLEKLTNHPSISCITLNKLDNILFNNNIHLVELANKQTIEADIVVLATANHTHQFSQTAHIPTQAVRGQVSFLSANAHSAALKTILCSDGYLSPSINGLHSLGATFSTEHLSLSINEQDHQANLNVLNTLSPSLQANLSQITGGRASLRCTTTDYFPLVGPLIDAQRLIQTPPRPSASKASLPWLNGLYINTAHGSRGFISAPYCAALLAQLICGEPLSLNADSLGLLNPNRFLLKKLGLKRLAKM